MEALGVPDGNPISPFLKQERNPHNGHYWFKCPGCERHHCIILEGVGSWDVVSKNPLTIMPSVRVSLPEHKNSEGVTIPEKTLCHLYIKNGYIEYLNDSRHHLAGKTVPMEVPTINVGA